MYPAAENFTADELTVPGKLLRQSRNRGERPFIADSVNEFHGYVQTVDILIEVENIGFDGPFPSVADGRSHSYVRHPGIDCPAHRNSRGIDAVGGNRLEGE